MNEKNKEGFDIESGLKNRKNC